MKREQVMPYVLADLQLRIDKGTSEYGEPLTTHNDRDALWDAYEECLDLALYLRQAILERSDDPVVDGRTAYLESKGARRRVAHEHQSFVDGCYACDLIQRLHYLEVQLEEERAAFHAAQVAEREAREEADELRAEVARLREGDHLEYSLAVTNDELRARLRESEAENDQWQKKLAEVWAENERLRAQLESHAW